MDRIKKIQVKASREYEVILGRGLLGECNLYFPERLKCGKAVIVTDDNVAPLYLERAIKSLELKNIKTLPIIIKHGETSKNFSTAEELLEGFAQFGLTRSDIAVALGGGVVGDLCGFATSVYLRGIDYIQLPTTLLAAVDSSVGGKTAVDLKAGKNLCGAFHQPIGVICDTDTFATLTPHFYSDGIAEMIKYGVICDYALFERFKEPDEVKSDIVNIAARCVELKRDAVERDEFDNGDRKLLNLGHTVGHAIEKLSGYTITHGHAVAAGMSVIAYVSSAAGLLDNAECRKLTETLNLYGLPVKTEFTAHELANIASFDKKVEGSEITLAIPEKIGRTVLLKLPLSRLEGFLADGIKLMKEDLS